MELIKNIDIPPYTRMAWVSQEAKDKWQERVDLASHVAHILEKETVKYGLRKCTTYHASSTEFDQDLRRFAREGLVFLPITRVGAYSGFAHYHPPVVEGKPWRYYGVVARDINDAYEFFEASKNGDHRKIAELLGYPECCVDFFYDVWMKGYYDPIWQQALNSDQSNIKFRNDNLVRVDNKVYHEVSSILRYIGLRIAPQLTCSLTCKPSYEIAKKWIDLARYDLREEGIEYLIEIMHWPVEWDCLKGIAIISTPLFKISTNSMPCYPKYVVQKDGDTYPDCAPKALKFPWNQPLRVKVRDIIEEA